MTQYNIVVSSPQLDIVNDVADVVTSVYVALYAVYDGSIGQSIGMRVDLAPPPEQPIPFDQLTEDEVKQWVMSTETYQQMLAIVDAAYAEYVSSTTEFVFNKEA